ncbi:MAG: tetratricopeptide repeat protein [Paludibacter sp.]
MFKVIIIALFFPVLVMAQQTITYQTADSVTFACYLNGDWEKLINYGNEAIRQDVDFKNLRKRLGYAHFVKNEFYFAIKQYEKALQFDKNDMDIILYLYYCGLKTSDATIANFYASKLTLDLQKSEALKSSKLLQSADFELNYKINDDSLDIRSNPTYYRFGIMSRLNYRFNLYQAFSQYTQTVNTTTATLQSEYYAGLNFTANAHNSFDIAYHYVGTKVDTTLFGGHLFFGKYIHKVGALNYGVNTSLLTNLMGNYTQFGVFGGLTFGAKSNFYLNSSLSLVTDSVTTNFIFAQTLGARIAKPLWLEGNITLGNLKNYNDNNALYIYNSLDATVFRAGSSAFLNISKGITLFTNYTYDLKQLDDIFLNIKYNYNQHSISGGLIWKL